MLCFMMEKKFVYGVLTDTEAETKIRNKINEMQIKTRLYEYALESKHTVNLYIYGESREFSIRINNKEIFYFNYNFLEKESCMLFYMPDRRIYPSIHTEIKSFPSLDEAFDVFSYCYIDLFRKIGKLSEKKKIDRTILIRNKISNPTEDQKVFFLIDETNGKVKSEKPIDLVLKSENITEIATMVFDSKNNVFELDSIHEVEGFDINNYWTEYI